MALPLEIKVEIEVGKSKITLTSDEGDLATIEKEFFEESPRRAIQLADAMAMAPEMIGLVEFLAGIDVEEKDLDSLRSAKTVALQIMQAHRRLRID